MATVQGGLEAIEDRTALHWFDVPLCVRASLQPTTHLLLGTASENMKDRAFEGRTPSSNAARWRRLGRAERAARSRHLREQHDWDQGFIRQLVHDVDPKHRMPF
ncbi:hypothetical protein [Kocuria sp. CH-021]|uniref:hypothetical protein n=1 Tax=Kocuria sp. CH-021 TaxID=3406735 RepID=UPI003C778452